MVELIWPVQEPYVITQTFEEHIQRKKELGLQYYNPGLDIAPQGAKVFVCPADGVAVLAEYQQSGYGNVIKLDHSDGIVTLGAHLAEIWVAPGEKVSQGQYLGVIGSTGNSTGTHLHFEVRRDGVCVDPVGYLGNTDRPPSIPPKGGRAAEFQMGDMVRVISDIGLNLRSAPELDDGVLVGRLMFGAQAEVTGEMIEANGYRWAPLRIEALAAVESLDGQDRFMEMS